MKKIYRIGTTVTFAIMCTQGCSSTCIVALPDSNASNAIHAVGIVNGNRYIVAEPDDPAQLTSRGLHDVVVKDNWFFDFLGTISLGLYKPYEVSYRNVKPGVDPGGPMNPAPTSRGR